MNPLYEHNVALFPPSPKVRLVNAIPAYLLKVRQACCCCVSDEELDVNDWAGLREVEETALDEDGSSPWTRWSVSSSSAMAWRPPRPVIVWRCSSSNESFMRVAIAGAGWDSVLLSGKPTQNILETQNPLHDSACQ